MGISKASIHRRSAKPSAKRTKIASLCCGAKAQVGSTVAQHSRHAMLGSHMKMVKSMFTIKPIHSRPAMWSPMRTSGALIGNCLIIVSPKAVRQKGTPRKPDAKLNATRMRIATSSYGGGTQLAVIIDVRDSKRAIIQSRTMMVTLMCMQRAIKKIITYAGAKCTKTAPQQDRKGIAGIKDTWNAGR